MYSCSLITLFTYHCLSSLSHLFAQSRIQFRNVTSLAWQGATTRRFETEVVAGMSCEIHEIKPDATGCAAVCCDSMSILLYVSHI